MEYIDAGTLLEELTNDQIDKEFENVIYGRGEGVEVIESPKKTEHKVKGVRVCDWHLCRISFLYRKINDRFCSPECRIKYHSGLNYAKKKQKKKGKNSLRGGFFYVGT
ncbi:hypothetical protein [Tindallia californiensis]|uniref:Uncharacterized protein n=1 Tax=Tindallia californiensis TaxID=159292 RepID=A0A1H3RGG8_9FIRM|nr:hypothetical protein [Tindallia californiensis]SDZ24321.1 hypothetical protein SAMN05192546_1209 [Tindallia californiensis]